jgi:hypothetical protein
MTANMRFCEYLELNSVKYLFIWQSVENVSDKSCREKLNFYAQCTFSLSLSVFEVIEQELLLIS